MRRTGSAVYLSIAVALYCGALLLAQAGGQGAAGARAGGPPGQGGFVAYPQRPVTDPAAVDRGKALFSVNCGFCHGPDARGGDAGGPNLMRSDVVLLDDKGERIGQVVKQGRPDKGMPPFMLSDAQIGDIAAFLHSLPVSSRTGETVVNIVTGNAAAGQAYFSSKCSTCHSATGDLKGVATRYADPKMLQQTWLLPGTGGNRGGGSPRPAPPITAVVTLSNGQTVTGTLNRLDDFVVALTLPDGSHRAFQTTGPNAAKLQLRDPLGAHKELLKTYSDADIHNITAYLVTLK